MSEIEPEHKTKEFTIKWHGKDEKIVIKKLGYIKLQTFREEFSEVKLQGDIMRVFLHPYLMRPAALKHCIVSSPFDLKKLDDYIEKDEHKVLDQVYEEIKSFIGLDEEDRKNSDGESNTEQANPESNSTL